jgi:hypothetical protein
MKKTGEGTEYLLGAGAFTFYVLLSPISFHRRIDAGFFPFVPEVESLAVLYAVETT